MQSMEFKAPSRRSPGQPAPYSLRQWISLALVVVGCGLLGYVGGQYWYMALTQRQLETSWQAQQAETGDPAIGTAGVGATKGADRSLTRLEIPRIKLKAIVLEGADRQQLLVGPGHLSDTVMPGEDGNAVITAHRDTFFRHLFELEAGDEIVVQRNGRVYRYQVTGKKVVAPTDLSVIRPTPDAQLTLITCYPIYYIGPAPDRLAVFSRLESPGGEPVTKPAAAVR